MINLLVGTALACVLGVPLALIGVALSRPDTGTRCRSPRPGWHPLRRAAGLRNRLAPVAAGVWEWLRTFEFPAPPAPDPAAGWGQIRAGMAERGPASAKPWALTDEDIREQWERARVDSPFLPPLRPCCPTTAEEAHRAGCEAASVPPADPASPETRLLRAIFGLCPECDLADPHDHDTPEGPYRYGDGEHGYVDEIDASGPAEPGAIPPYSPRHDATLPRRRPIADRQPWQTAQQPVYGEAAQLVVEPGLGVRPFAGLALGPDGCEEVR